MSRSPAVIHVCFNLIVPFWTWRVSDFVLHGRRVIPCTSARHALMAGRKKNLPN
jgi:hypothetical protein